MEAQNTPSESISFPATATNSKLDHDFNLEMDKDYPCSECGKLIHFDILELEGDESYIIPRYDGKGGEDVLCSDCWDKLGWIKYHSKYKGHYP